MSRWIVILLFFTAAGTFECRAADLSAEQLRDELLRSCRAVDSIHVRYRGSSALPDRHNYIVREVAAKRPCFYYHHGTHGGNDIDWRDDPYQQKAWVLADTYFNEFVRQRVYFQDALNERSP